jgi:hypothetical protein
MELDEKLIKNNIKTICTNYDVTDSWEVESIYRIFLRRILNEYSLFEDRNKYGKFEIEDAIKTLIYLKETEKAKEGQMCIIVKGIQKKLLFNPKVANTYLGNSLAKDLLDDPDCFFRNRTYIGCKEMWDAFDLKDSEEYRKYLDTEEKVCAKIEELENTSTSHKSDPEFYRLKTERKNAQRVYEDKLESTLSERRSSLTWYYSFLTLDWLHKMEIEWNNNKKDWVISTNTNNNEFEYIEYTFRIEQKKEPQKRNQLEGKCFKMLLIEPFVLSTFDILPTENPDAEEDALDVVDMKHFEDEGNELTLNIPIGNGFWKLNTTKKYSLIFDIFHMAKLLPDSNAELIAKGTPTEKYHYVRDRIKSWEAFLKK